MKSSRDCWLLDKNDRKRLKAEHMQSIRKAKDAKQTGRHIQAIEKYVQAGCLTLHTACPKCNGKLTLKTGRYGKFYGCSNYPDCRYTENVNA